MFVAFGVGIGEQLHARCVEAFAGQGYRGGDVRVLWKRQGCFARSSLEERARGDRCGVEVGQLLGGGAPPGAWQLAPRVSDIVQPGNARRRQHVQPLLLAERVLRDVDTAVTEVKGLLDKAQGRVVVAASPLAAATLLPAMIGRFAGVYPNVVVELHDMLTDQILLNVRGGTADIGVGTFEKSHTELELSTIHEDVLGVLMPVSNALSRRRVLRWRDLRGEELISLSRTSAFRPLIDSMLAGQAGHVLAPRFEVGYMGTAVALVEAGLGLSILPERAASLATSQSVCFRRLTAPKVSRPVTLVTRVGRTLSPAAHAFSEFLSQGE